MSKSPEAIIRQSTQPVAVVLGLSSNTGLSIIRSLGRRGVPVIGVGKSHAELAGRSRYCQSVMVCPSEQSLVEFLEHIGGVGKNKMVLYCESDEYVRFASRHLALVNTYFQFLLSANISVDALLNKKNMIDLARQAGIPVPQTVEGNTASNAAGKLPQRFPQFIKPLYTQPWERTKGELVHSADDLLLPRIQERFKSGYIAQELIAGPDTNVWLYTGYTDGDRTMGLVLQKLRQIPKGFGSTTAARTEDKPELRKLGDRFLAHIRYKGFFEIEFKKDDRDKVFKFIEMNARLGGVNSLAEAAGVNLAYAAYQHVVYKQPIQEIQQHDNVSWVSIIDDFITVYKYYRLDDRRALGDWLKRSVHSQAYADWSVTDIGPFIAKILWLRTPVVDSVSWYVKHDGDEPPKLREQTARFISRAEKPIAVVLGLSSQTGVSLVRCLGECGIPVVGIDRAPGSLGSFSRYCNVTEIAPTKEVLLSLLLQIARRSREKPVILLESDPYVRFIDLYREQLSEYFHLVGSARIPLRQFMEKSVMQEYARQAGVPVPRTIMTKSNYLNPQDADAMHYPCFIKPLYSQPGERKKGIPAQSKEELLTSIKNERFRNGALIQEVIPGPETNLWSYSGFRGEKVCVGITRYKVRQIPKDFGMGTLTTSSVNNEVEALGKRLLESVDYRGQFGIEFKKDARDGTYKFVEINMRTLGGNELYRGLGFNIPRVAYCDAIKQPCELHIDATKKVTWISEIDDFITCVRNYAPRNTIRAVLMWLKALLVAQRVAVFSWRDPLPFFVKAFRYLIGYRAIPKGQKYEPMC